MSEFTEVFLIANAYRFLLIVSGILFGYFGYRLFALGFYEKAGELKAAFGEKNLTLKQVAPGVFFAIFGVAITVVSAARGIKLERPVANAIPAEMKERVTVNCSGISEQECLTTKDAVRTCLGSPQPGLGVGTIGE